MQNLKWPTLLVVLALLIFALAWHFKDDVTRITATWTAKEAEYPYFTAPDVLRYILSFRTQRRPLNDIDYFIFAPLQARMAMRNELRHIDIRTLLESDVPEERPVLNLYKITLPKENGSLQHPQEELKSGFDIGREGLVYKVVIPTDSKIVNIMGVGVEPDQTENLENITLSPKATFEVVIPLK